MAQLVMRVTVSSANSIWRRSTSCLGFLLLAGLPFIVSCDFLTRFEQERYECPANPTGILELDFRSASIGEEAKVVFTDRTITGRIIESTDVTLSVNADNMVIRADRSSALVRLTRGARYVHVQCRKSVFKM